MRRIPRRFRFAPLLAVGLAACATATVKIDAQRQAGADFSRYHTYRWRSPATPIPQLGANGASFDRRIRATTEQALAQKGLVMNDAGADLLVDYRIVVKDKQAGTFREFAEYKQMGGDAMVSEAYVEGYQEGTLILELYDSATNQLAWRATATALVGTQPDPERVQTAIRQMISQLPTK